MIVAIDPGVRGAIAHLHDDGRFCCVADMDGSPVLLASYIRDLRKGQETRVILEHLSYMPGFGGGSGMFRMGQHFGEALGVIAALGIPMELVRPAIWKKAMGLGRDKEASRLKALQLFPDAAESLKRKKDEGRAEALLLGLWFARRLGTHESEASQAG